MAVLVIIQMLFTNSKSSMKSRITVFLYKYADFHHLFPYSDNILKGFENVDISMNFYWS